jgi:D-amino-acid oxidase
MVHLKWSQGSNTKFSINTAIYLPWLVSQCLKNGVVFKRAIFKHIKESSAPSIFNGKKVHVVVNCTGLGAAKLGGVEDKTVVPARGQIVVVRNDAGKMMDISGTDDGPEEACYVMTRAAGGGECHTLHKQLMSPDHDRYYPWRLLPKRQLGVTA